MLLAILLVVKGFCLGLLNVRWADAEYQFIADQKAKDLAYDMENNGKGLIVSQRTDALIQLGCTGSVVSFGLTLQMHDGTCSFVQLGWCMVL